MVMLSSIVVWEIQVEPSARAAPKSSIPPISRRQNNQTITRVTSPKGLNDIHDNLSPEFCTIIGI